MVRDRSGLLSFAKNEYRAPSNFPSKVSKTCKLSDVTSIVRFQLVVDLCTLFVSVGLPWESCTFLIRLEAEGVLMASPSSPSQLRLLILSPAAVSSDHTTSPPLFPPLLDALTSEKPSTDIKTFSGYTSHPALHLKTKYYEADVSIWCDELSPPASSKAFDRSSEGLNKKGDTLEQWKEQMLSKPASEVRAVIGGIILLLPASSKSRESEDVIMQYVQAVNSLREAIEDESGGRDVAAAIVVQSVASKATESLKDSEQYLEKLEDKCQEVNIFGWDFVACNGTSEVPQDDKSKFGEKTGLPRLIEVLEAVDWSVAPQLSESDLGNEWDTPHSPTLIGDPGFSPLDAELQQEMMGLKMSMLEDDSDKSAAKTIEGSDEDMSVEQMSALMERVVAIKAAGADMPDVEREKFAKREVDKIMTELS